VAAASVVPMSSTVSDLDATGLLAAASEAERAVRLAEVARLEVLSAWAVVHSTDPTEGPDGHVAKRLGNVLRPVGGEGTPGVQDFCLGEIALARGAGVTATVNMLADVLDLQHRLPLTWAVCRRGECEVWVARRVAKLSRHLAADKVGVVDSAVSRMIATEGPGRVLQVAEAKIIEADTELHEERCEAERRRRYVGLGAHRRARPAHPRRPPRGRRRRRRRRHRAPRRGDHRPAPPRGPPRRAPRPRLRLARPAR
jgi:hypothetical protein